MTTAPASPVSSPVALAPRERRRHRAAPPPRSYGKPMAALALAGVAVATGSSPAVAADHKPVDPTSTTGQMPALSPALAAHAAAKARAAEQAEQARAEQARAATQAREAQAAHEARAAQLQAQAAAQAQAAQAQAAVQPAAQQSSSWAAWSSTTRPTPAVPAAAAPSGAATQGDRTDPALTTTGSTPSLLLLGSEGRRVAAWQHDLSAWRAAHGRSALATDGSFGPTTLNATVDFQRSTGVRVDGIVGPITNGAMSQQTGTTATTSSSAVQATPVVDIRSTAAASGTRAEAVAATAQRYLGVPYVYGGASTAGFDCSGFTQYVFHQLGVDLPRTSAAQAAAGTAVSSSEARLGDLVFFYSGGHVYHVGIYLGGGRMIAAPKPGDRVKVEAVYSSDVTYRRVV